MERKSRWTAVSALATVGLVVIGALQLRQSRNNVSFTVPVKAQATSESGGRDTSLEFQVKKCNVEAKTVWCSLTVLSPGYDRRLVIMSFQTALIDNDGDRFPMTGLSLNLMLDRNQKMTFKVQFPVNKDIVRPATVQLVGYIDYTRFEKGFELK